MQVKGLVADSLLTCWRMHGSPFTQAKSSNCYQLARRECLLGWHRQMGCQWLGCQWLGCQVLHLQVWPVLTGYHHLHTRHVVSVQCVMSSASFCLRQFQQHLGNLSFCNLETCTLLLRGLNPDIANLLCHPHMNLLNSMWNSML